MTQTPPPDGRGFLLVPRDLLEGNPFGSPQVDAYDRRSAFLWLVSAARWTDGVVQIGGRPVKLRRGQLSFSQRFLAKAWGWETTKVRRFFAMLSRCGRVEWCGEPGQLLITILNYEQYQSFAGAAEASGVVRCAATAPEPHQDRTSAAAKKNPRIQESRNPSKEDSLRESATPVPEVAPPPPDPGPAEALKGRRPAEVVTLRMGLVEQAVIEWNLLARTLRLPMVRPDTLSDTRRRKLAKRLEAGGIAVWREALAAVERSAFLRGENSSGWRCDFDALCQERTWNRVLEGFYDKSRNAKPQRSAEGTLQGIDAALAAMEGRWPKDPADDDHDVVEHVA